MLAFNMEPHGDVSHDQTIRKAVGAIAYQGSKFILVRKISNTGKEQPEVWDFPKGGVEAGDSSLEDAVMRELLEETGTDQYIVKQELPWKISIDFDEDMRKQIGYERQETTMFLVEFIGNESDLMPRDKEIDEIMLVDAEDLINKLSHEETAQYVQRYGHLILR